MSLEKLGRRDEAIAKLEEGIAAIPGDPDLHFTLGRILSHAGRHQEAAEHYRQVMQCNPIDHFSSIDVGILSFKLYHNLANEELQLGNYEEAKRLYLSALECAPEFLPSAFALFDASVDQGDLATSTRMMETVRLKAGLGESWAQMVMRYSKAGDDLRHGIGLLHQALNDQPYADGVRMVLARELLELGDVAHARAHLEHLDRQEWPEAPYLLGVLALQSGQFELALKHMERSLSLNAGHEQTIGQIEGIRSLLS